jgi:hypothetical protein
VVTSVAHLLAFLPSKANQPKEALVAENSIADLKKYLSTPDRPVSMGEFKEFWDSCTEEEKTAFKETKLT